MNLENEVGQVIGTEREMITYEGHLVSYGFKCGVFDSMMEHMQMYVEPIECKRGEVPWRRIYRMVAQCYVTMKPVYGEGRGDMELAEASRRTSSMALGMPFQRQRTGAFNLL